VRCGPSRMAVDQPKAGARDDEFDTVPPDSALPEPLGPNIRHDTTIPPCAASTPSMRESDCLTTHPGSAGGEQPAAHADVLPGSAGGERARRVVAGVPFLPFRFHTFALNRAERRRRATSARNAIGSQRPRENSIGVSCASSLRGVHSPVLAPHLEPGPEYI
jgi:hypothetical protein